MTISQATTAVLHDEPQRESHRPVYLRPLGHDHTHRDLGAATVDDGPWFYKLAVPLLFCVLVWGAIGYTVWQVLLD